MEKTIAGLLGAVGALVATTQGHAAPSIDLVLQANSYSELLRPVPNALETLRAMDAATPEGRVELVQLGPAIRALVRPRHHHHHHHHHRYYARRRYHHHHHHHASVFR